MEGRSWSLLEVNCSRGRIPTKKERQEATRDLNAVAKGEGENRMCNEESGAARLPCDRVPTARATRCVCLDKHPRWGLTWRCKEQFSSFPSSLVSESLNKN